MKGKHIFLRFIFYFLPLFIGLVSCKSKVSVDIKSINSAQTYESYDLRTLINDHKTSLVHYFNFDDTVIRDLGNKKEVVTTVGVPYLADDLIGKSAGFNGSLDGQADYFDINLSDESFYSFSFWIYNDSAKEETTQYLMQSDRFLIHDRGAQRPALEINGTNGSRTIFKVDATDAYNQNEWTHIVYTLDLSNPFSGDSSGLCKVYINGTPIVVLIDTEITAGFGARPNNVARFGNSLSLTRPFVGKYDDIGIFNRLLTSDEVLTIYNAQK